MFKLVFHLQVPRIVQLMQKFSKKLVSKCIYIHILCASTPELLELFLTQKGWDLLNAWFTDAFANQNYFLCSDLIKLFALCPMTSTRLKENVEINQVIIISAFYHDNASDSRKIASHYSAWRNNTRRPNKQTWAQISV